MKAPIIVDENGDVSVFETVEFAQRALEATDVLNDEYVAYDSEGRLLQMKVIDGGPLVSIREAEDAPHHVDDLRRVLGNFLSRTGNRDASLKEDTVQHLLAKFISVHGYTP